MTLLAVVVFWVLAGLVVVQAAMVAMFTWALRGNRRPLPDDASCPKTAVILCLRGTDPFLPATLEAVLDLDYPDFELRVVVDSREDPAWRVVEQVVSPRGATNVRIEPLEQRLETCSLKCSSVVQTVSRLDESYEVVALLDADTIPHRSWLRELVAPLADENVGAATGNRWYMPQQVTMAAMIRYVWNAAAVPQMWWYKIAWGGTLAVKTEVFRRGDLLDRWSNAFCEDTMLYRMLRRHGLRVEFVPSLIMINRESCDLSGFFRWVRRQLLTARLYHPGWAAVVLHGVSTTLWPTVALVLCVVSAALGRWEAFSYALAGLLGYECCMPLLLAPMEAAVRRIARRRGEPTGWMTPGVLAWYLVSVPLTQIVYAAALASALTLRSVDWRGVHYRIDGPFRIRLVEYKPFQSETPDDAHASL
ncbi:MAG: glycosyltransferase family 2 protein [Pirellulaceae bacterium]